MGTCKRSSALNLLLTDFYDVWSSVLPMVKLIGKLHPILLKKQKRVRAIYVYPIVYYKGTEFSFQLRLQM